MAEAANSRWSPPQAGIFSGHLEYAEWYAKWWDDEIDSIEEVDSLTYHRLASFEDYEIYPATFS